ncbi:hypothetical protein H0H87_006017 [Tephrocybe sp. NHM501043]|nr:hypothetical protein H0H87_006017 [Tephrocybe sp. NHM501043]
MPVLSRIRLFPSSPPKIHSTPLSILDAQAVRFAPSAGVWVFKGAPTVDELTISLKITLDAYPQWTGQLHWAPYIPSGGGHTQRFGRLMLSYGKSDDPGVEFIAATSPHTIASFGGDAVDGCTNVTNLPFANLIDSTTPLALHDAINYAGLPSLSVQITTLADNGVAIAIKFAHPLADAQTLLQFTHDWAAVSRVVVAQGTLPTLSPVFDPSLLDRAAAGDIDASHPSSEILEVARPLPLHRYDCWNSKPNSPPFMKPLVTAPPEVEATVGELGQPIDWVNWDYTAPVSHFLIEFSPSELDAMWKDAGSYSRVSHLDALLAHIWNLIIRAQKIDGEFHLDVTFGFRNRVNPPLPPSFLGSPLTLTKVTATAKDAIDHRLGPMAASIRSSLNAFNGLTIPALLHEMAYEVSPLRKWSAFFGSRNTIITSWLQLGMRDVDFGKGAPIHVDAVMPSTDGCVQVMEADQSSPGKKAWHEKGGIVSLHMRGDVIQRILKDPALRKYRA